MNALLELDLVSPSCCLDVYTKTVQYQSLSVYVCAYNYSMSISYNNGGGIRINYTYAIVCSKKNTQCSSNSVLHMIALLLEKGSPADMSHTASSASLRPCPVMTLHSQLQHSAA